MGDFFLKTRPMRRSVLLATASFLTGWAPLLAANAAHAQSTPSGEQSTPTTTVGEIIVTASRRSESLAKLPFNISAFASKQLERANISNIAALSQEVPNFVVQDQGPRSTASSIPIIRGLNASQPVVTSARYFQSPVGFYLGDSPITGSLPLEDVERVEVLRGPQGTLYGAGTLSGAVRVMPNDPKLNNFSGLLSVSAADVSHSSHLDNDVLGVINIPVGDDLAIRVVAKREYDAGFIDLNNIMKRAGNNYLNGAPLLANPSDVVNSPAVYFNAKDVNYATTTSVRASLLWTPVEKLKLRASYSYAYVRGNGAPIDNYNYAGGASPIDPRLTLAPTGNYQRSLPTLEPYDRRTQLGDVDLSYDLGFATLSTTVAYGRSDGVTVSDGTAILLGSPYGFYYTGTPANPRSVIPVYNKDVEKSYTEEIRLVSRESKFIDYTVGAFFQQDSRLIGLGVFDPGADVQSAAAHGGSTVPLVEGGTAVPLFSNGAAYLQNSDQQFRDYSIYGDATWHVTDRWQITGGARVFYQTFSQALNEESSLFEFTVNADNANFVSSQIFKANTSYQLAPSTQTYFTFSQGFRRGGANAFPTQGAVLEPIELLNYKPDTTNNYEVGLKGTAYHLYYSVDLFYVDWSDPQIDLLTPYTLTAVVVNGNSAASKGAEFEVSGPLGPRGLTFNLGAAYSPARLTQSFSLPAGNAAGGVVQNAITGQKGDRLPGTPDISASANINYKVDVSNSAALTFSLGADYRSSTVNVLPHFSSFTPATTAPGYTLMHGSIDFEMHDWQVELFGTNLSDSHVVLATQLRALTSHQLLGDWGNSYAVARPREIGLRLTRRW